MNVVFWTLVAFISGAIPFSLLVGRFGLHTDIRQYGDGNPGASNVFRAGGKSWGILAILLDGFKGAIPVWLAIDAGVEGWGLTAVALAPIYGHAFSPFLKFKGGKALAVTFGVWTGLTLWRAPVVMGFSFAAGLFLLTVEGWAVILGMAALLVYLLLSGAQAPLLAVWLGNLLVILWTHRADLRQRPRIRPLQNNK